MFTIIGILRGFRIPMVQYDHSKISRTKILDVWCSVDMSFVLPCLSNRKKKSNTGGTPSPCLLISLVFGVEQLNCIFFLLRISNHYCVSTNYPTPQKYCTKNCTMIRHPEASQDPYHCEHCVQVL